MIRRLDQLLYISSHTGKMPRTCLTYALCILPYIHLNNTTYTRQHDKTQTENTTDAKKEQKQEKI